MLSFIWELITHPKIFLIGLLIGYLAPSNIVTVVDQFVTLGGQLLTWIKSKF